MSQTDPKTDEDEQEESSQEADESDNEAVDEESYKRATFYFRESLKKEFERWLKMKELEHPETVDHDEIERRDQHEAIIRVVMENEDLFLDYIEENFFEDEEA